MRNFTWMEKCRLTFEELKKFIVSPSLLSKLEVKEELFLYLIASSKAISSMLVRVDDKGIYKPIYYTSKMFHDAKTKYSKSKNIIFALIISAQYLKPYF